MKYIYTTFIILTIISCNSTYKKPNNKNTKEKRFVRVDDSLAIGTSLILNRKVKKTNSMIGDFLSRIWNIYGKPKQINYEGFTYTFKDTKTNLIFTAYSAGSGPAYGGRKQERELLIPILKLFDQIIENTDPANCSIKFETDFGTMKSGAKNGVPYDSIPL